MCVRKIILITIYLSGAAAALNESQVIQQQWNEFKISYNRTYKSAFDESAKLKIFKTNLRNIVEHNKLFEDGTVTYTIGINRFGDVSYEEYKNMNTPNETEFEFGSPKVIKLDEAAKIPTSINWRQRGAVTNARDQQICGSCWAFAAIANLEGQYFRKTGILEEFSEQELVDCVHGLSGCKGAGIYKAYNYFTKNGISTRTSYPYRGENGKCRRNQTSKVKVFGYAEIKDVTTESLKRTLAQNGPVEVGINTFHENFMRYSGGIFNDLVCDFSANHAVLLVGYETNENTGKDYWIVKNSHGATWGENGFMRIAANSNCFLDPIFPLLSLDYHFVDESNVKADNGNSISTREILILVAKIIPIVFCLLGVLFCCFGAIWLRADDDKDDDEFNLNSESSDKMSNTTPLTVAI